MKFYKLISLFLVVTSSLANYIEEEYKNEDSNELDHENFIKRFIRSAVDFFDGYETSEKFIDVFKRDQTKTKPKVSVIIPTHNNEKLIGRCIDSALNQTLKDIEIIVIDDASTDSTKSIIMDYTKKDSRVKGLYSSRNRGSGYSRNKGIQEATADYVGFIDSDDYVDPGWFEYLFNNHWDKDLVRGIRVIHNFQEEYTKSHSRPYGCIIPSIIRKGFLTRKRIKFPENRTKEDAIFRDRLYRRKPRIAYLPDNGIYYHYVKREGSLSKYVNNTSDKRNIIIRRLY